MSALLDTVYDVTRNCSHRGPPEPYAIEAIEEACPGHPQTEYLHAYECARRLKELALELADKWWSNLLAESEAREHLAHDCPGFASTTYDKAWSQATHFIWR
jgi:hypothetical protein